MTDPILKTPNLTTEFGTLRAVGEGAPEIEQDEFRSLIGPNGA